MYDTGISNHNTSLSSVVVYDMLQWINNQQWQSKTQLYL